MRARPVRSHRHVDDGRVRSDDPHRVADGLDLAALGQQLRADQHPHPLLPVAVQGLVRVSVEGDGSLFRPDDARDDPATDGEVERQPPGLVGCELQRDESVRVRRQHLPVMADSVEHVVGTGDGGVQIEFPAVLRRSCRRFRSRE